MSPKLIQRNIPPDRENTSDRFRVKYGNKNDFKILEVKITRLATGEQLVFQFNSASLPDKDSIHFSTSIVNNSLRVKWFNIQPLPNKTKYSCLEFNGELLNPSFSIYLFEIKKGVKKYFYIGMTGDNHYPSARSILHRLSGHIDLGKRSTQSQFLLAVKSLFGKTRDEYLTLNELKSIDIKLHHWSISGFERWNGDMKLIDKKSPKYQGYKKKQKRVSNLENKMIKDFSGKHLLNKTISGSYAELNNDELKIYNKVNEIIKQK